MLRWSGERFVALVVACVVGGWLGAAFAYSQRSDPNEGFWRWLNTPHLSNRGLPEQVVWTLVGSLVVGGIVLVWGKAGQKR